MIELSGVSCCLNGVRILDDLSFTVERGQVFAVIGPNGSGKTTTLNLVAGLLRPTAGKILFDGRDLNAVPLHQRIGLGIARTFQNGRLAQNLTVFENLKAADYARRQDAKAGTPSSGNRGCEIQRTLKDFNLAEKKDLLAEDLSFRERQRLELARAIVARPRLLLLDEPAAGMDAPEMEQLERMIIQLRAEGVAVLLVEHMVDFVMKLADRIAVLNLGRKITEGLASEVARNSTVQKLYLSETP